MKTLSDLLVEYGEHFAETTPAADDHALTLLHEFALAVGAINYPDAYLVDLLGDSLNDQWPHLFADGLQYEVASAVLKGLCGLKLDQVSPFVPPAATPQPLDMPVTLPNGQHGLMSPELLELGVALTQPEAP